MRIDGEASEEDCVSRNNPCARVFAYGTLRRGQSNNCYLQEGYLLGSHITPPIYNMFDLGPYPAVLEGGDTAIVGEVYAVTPTMLKGIDRLEGYPDYYHRKLISTRFGLTWIYLFKKRIVKPLRKLSGDWCGRN